MPIHRLHSCTICRWVVGLAMAWFPGLALPTVHADDWPQWLGPQRDGVWRENGILTQFPADGPKVRWRTPIEGGYAGPAVAQGKVYVTDRVLAQGTKNPKDPFARSNLPGKERVLCLEEATGKVLWVYEYDCHYKVSYPAGPRTTPLVDGERVYTLGAMGDLLCLDTANGKVHWSKHFIKDYQAQTPIWGFSAAPLLDGDKLICMVGGKDSTAVAFNKNTGAEIWRALSAKQLGYAPPMIYEFGGKRQLIIWHPQAVNGLDPETGKVYWTVPFQVSSELSVPSPRKADDLLLVSSFYNGSLMLRVTSDSATPAVVWKSKGKGETPTKTDTLNSIMPTPYMENGFIYGICSYGELRCLKADTGERVWQSLQATGSKEKMGDRWKNAFLIPHEDHVFLFNEQGDLIIARLSPKGYEEVSRAHVIEPTNDMPGRLVVWSHPAFANKCAYIRNDKEIICVSLAAN